MLNVIVLSVVQKQLRGANLPRCMNDQRWLLNHFIQRVNQVPAVLHDAAVDGTALVYIHALDVRRDANNDAVAVIEGENIEANRVDLARDLHAVEDTTGG